MNQVKIETNPNPSNKLISITSKVAEIQNESNESNEFMKRDMFVQFLGSEGLNLIDEDKHQQLTKRHLP